MTNAERTMRFIRAVQDEMNNMADHNPELNRALMGMNAHTLAMAHDTGKSLVLTGRDIRGKKIRREVKSFVAAYALLTASYGYTRVWQVFHPAGRRMLAFHRSPVS